MCLFYLGYRISYNIWKTVNSSRKVAYLHKQLWLLQCFWIENYWSINEYKKNLASNRKFCLLDRWLIMKWINVVLLHEKAIWGKFYGASCSKVSYPLCGVYHSLQNLKFPFGNLWIDNFSFILVASLMFYSRYLMERFCTLFCYYFRRNDTLFENSQYKGSNT